MLIILPEFQEDFHEKENKGKEIAKTKNIAIIGLCRNVADKLQKNIKTLNGMDTNSTSFYIYENDSDDGTPEILENLSQNIDLNYKSEKLYRIQYGPVKSAQRTSNLAEYRNRCLEYAKENFADKDYIVVMDLDFVDFSTAGFYHSLCHLENDDVDAMAGFSYEPKSMNDAVFAWNYDCWAFRWYNWEDQQLYFKETKFNSMLWFGFWQPNIGSPPLKVNSAFGGSCIYKTDKYLNGHYTGEDCEHVTFHKSLKENNDKFQLYVNPAQTMLFQN